MPRERRKPAGLDWALIASGSTALITLVLFIPLIVWKVDIGAFLYAALAVVVSVAIVIVAIVLVTLGRFRKATLAAAITVAFGGISWLLLRNGDAIHSQGLWVMSGGEYRTAIVKQRAPANGQLKHVEWDGWGWGGQDTVVYLVFDPDDSLAAAAKTRKPGLYPGLPCEVYRVRRLQAHWYSVEFYTASIWTDCGSAERAASASTHP